MAVPQPHSPGQQVPPPQQQGSGCSGCFLGCGIATLLLLIAIGVGGWWAWSNRFEFIAQAVRGVANAVVDDLDLPAEEKRKINAQVDRLVEAVKDGEFDQAKLEKLSKELENGSFVILAMIKAVELKYVQESGLDEAEKEQARKDLSRLAHAIIEGKLTREQIAPLSERFMQEDANGQSKPKEQLTDAELREALVDVDRLADEAGVPDQKFEYSIGDHFKELIDRVLSE